MRGKASSTGSWASAAPGSQTGLGHVTPQLRVGNEQGVGHDIGQMRGAAPPRWTAQVFFPPQRLVGGALCRAEPSMTREGRGPVAKPPVMGPAAGARRGSQTALSKLPAGRCPEPLVGSALCWAEPSITGGWQDLQVKLVRRPPGVRRPTKWPAACAVLETVPGKNSRGARGSSAQGTGAPGEGGWVKQGRETELPPPPPPPPWVHQPARVDAGCCPDPEPLNGECEGLATRRPRDHRAYQTRPPPPRQCHPNDSAVAHGPARGPA